MARAKLTDEMFASIPGLLAEGLDRHQIAERFGVTSASLQVRCCKRKISLRRADLPVLRRNLPPPPTDEPPVHDWLSAEFKRIMCAKAEEHHTTPERLAGKLLRIICRDNLFDAVIDKGPHTYSDYYEAEPA